MKTPSNLFLASSSPSRQQLLKDSAIPFTVVSQSADESQIKKTTLEKTTHAIARLKMQKALLPDGSEGDVCFVLTADTLSEDTRGTLVGKPTSYDDAVSQLRAARNGMCTGTAFCLEKRTWQDEAWQITKQAKGYASAQYQFDVPDEWISWYLNYSGKLDANGAIIIEKMGNLFSYARKPHGFSLRMNSGRIPAKAPISGTKTYKD